MRSPFGLGDETLIVNGSKTAVCHDEIFPSIDKFPLKTLKLHTCMCHSSCKVSLHVRCKSWAKAVLCLNEVQGYFSPWQTTDMFPTLGREYYAER